MTNPKFKVNDRVRLVHNNRVVSYTPDYQPGTCGMIVNPKFGLKSLDSKSYPMRKVESVYSDAGEYLGDIRPYHYYVCFDNSSSYTLMSEDELESE